MGEDGAGKVEAGVHADFHDFVVVLSGMTDDRDEGVDCGEMD